MSYSDDFSDKMDDLKSEFNRLRAKAVDLFGSLFEASREGASHTGDQLRDHAEKWMDELQSTFRSLRSRGRNRLSDLGENVPAKPLLGLLLAVGVGVAVTHLLTHHYQRRD